MTTDSSGPAFPLPGVTWKYDEGAVTDKGHGGMTLRDYFAGQALVGVLAANSTEIKFKETDEVERVVAAAAYAVADAMIEARG